MTLSPFVPAITTQPSCGRPTTSPPFLTSILHHRAHKNLIKLPITLSLSRRPLQFIALTLYLLVSSATSVDGHREWLSWCGKHYEECSPVVPPVGQLPTVDHTVDNELLLDLRCTPSIQPYLAHEDTASILVDVALSSSRGVPFQPILPGMPFDATLSNEGRQAIILEEAVSPIVTISIYAGSIPLASVDVVVPSLGREVAFDLSLLPPSLIPYDLRCEVAHEGRTITFASDELRVLPPNPWNGGTVKIDRRTGGVLVPAEDEAEGWRPIIPAGFYTSYDDYLAKDGRHLDEMKALGFNLVHPVPTFSDLDVLKKTLDHARDIGLWLMYDMRHTFEDLASVREQAELIRSYPNLLVWYTADEPDGHESPLDSTKRAYDLLRSPDVDAGYHPVSLVLNCANYFFEPHASGADIVLTDPYPFNVNGTFSNVWHTPCNATYGVCGCDNCFTSSILDVSDRIDAYVVFRRQLGRERSLAFWAVPQAFGGSEFWTAVPTGAEFAQSAVLSLIHGCLGLVPWIAPSTPEIVDAASKISRSLASGLAQDFILSPRAKRTLLPPFKGVHLAAWTIPADSDSVKLLVLGARVAHRGANEPVEIQLREFGISGHKYWAIRDMFGLGGSGKVVVELHSAPERAVLVGEVLGDQGVVAWVLESGSRGDFVIR